MLTKIFGPTVAQFIKDIPSRPAEYEEPDQDLFDLLAVTNRIRRRNKQSQIFICSIVNAKSGSCSQDCAFCSQSAHHRTDIKNYPLLDEDELVSKAQESQAAGATQFSFVTSGRQLNQKEMDQVCRAAGKIRKQTDLSLCASLGMIDLEQATQLRESGVSRYHHNLETAESFFHHVCTTHEYSEDIETIHQARSAGLKVCSGGIMGLGETWEQRAELARTLRDLEVDSVPINFLHPIQGTKMESRPLVPPKVALACIGLFRLVLPKADIGICGGREITFRDLQALVFAAGANGIMVGNYLTTGGRDASHDRDMTAAMGLTRHAI
ncbi:biotin synthase BioB [Desulfovermiculus halophilus]|jgi:biotin synthase|uniref:biotin synthase BioB n=1 Tax=Desulfovermiculus halophilus TaxID=339722 RepID=UPI0006879066|nr:biotin synthase BioB [Desulfovermiculus halophilus]